jgi:hypothetical protein
MVIWLSEIQDSLAEATRLIIRLKSIGSFDYPVRGSAFGHTLHVSQAEDEALSSVSLR